MADWKTYSGRGALRAARWSGAATLAMRRTRPFGAIFTLHHVSPEPDGNAPPNGHLRITPAFLGRLIGHLRSGACDFVDLHEAVRRIETGRRDRFFVAFTLDDGYHDNKVHAAPVFRRENVPYTVFVSPGLSDGSVLPWWEVIEAVVWSNASVVLPGAPPAVVRTETLAEKRKAFDWLSRYLAQACDEGGIDAAVRRIGRDNGIAAPRATSAVMDWDAVARLAADPLCTIGAHSMGHPRLSRLPAEEALSQLRRSREAIAERLGRRPDFFAYPYGSPDACGEREFAMARALGYRASFTTRLHPLTDRTAANLQALPRLSLNGYYQDVGYVDVMMSGLPGLWKESRRRRAGPH